MDRTFLIGKRFLKLKYLCVIVNAFVVAAFYFIYRYLLEDAFPDLVNAPLAVVFLAVGAVVVKITLWVAEKYASGISYRVTEDGLIVVRGRLEELLPWDSFTAAKLQSYQFQGVFPVEFHLGKRHLILDQYIDELCRLTGLILDRIRDHAEIDPAVEQRVKDLMDIY